MKQLMPKDTMLKWLRRKGRCHKFNSRYYKNQLHISRTHAIILYNSNDGNR